MVVIRAGCLQKYLESTHKPIQRITTESSNVVKRTNGKFVIKIALNYRLIGFVLIVYYYYCFAMRSVLFRRDFLLDIHTSPVSWIKSKGKKRCIFNLVLNYMNPVLSSRNNTFLAKVHFNTFYEGLCFLQG